MVLASSRLDSLKVIVAVQFVIIILRSTKKEQDAGEEIKQSPDDRDRVG